MNEERPNDQTNALSLSRRYAMIITIQAQIDMAHRLPYHNGKCRNIHGHRYQIELGVQGTPNNTKQTSTHGMIADYHHLKTVINDQIDAKYDHGFVCSANDPHLAIFEQLRDVHNQKIIVIKHPPTAETLARLWYHALKRSLAVQAIIIDHVTVWETPTTTATYTIDDDRRGT